MSSLQVGDRVRRIRDGFGSMVVGDEDTVVGFKNSGITLDKFGEGHSEGSLELVKASIRTFRCTKKCDGRDCYSMIEQGPNGIVETVPDRCLYLNRTVPWEELL